MSRIHVTRRRLVKRGTAGLAVLLLGGLAACGAASGAGGSAGSITLYSGQHEQTTQSLVTAFEQQTGIHVNVRYNDEDSFADEIIAEKSHPVADVFYTENSPVLEYLQNQGLLASVEGSTLAKTPPEVQLTAGRLDRGVGQGQRADLQPVADQRFPAARVGAPAGQPEVQGEARVRGRRGGLPAHRHLGGRAYGDAKATTWLDGIKANAGSHVYPDNETIADEVNRGAVAFGVVNQYYWYRMKAELGASNVQSKIAYFAPHDPGYVVDVSGAGIIKSSKNKADAQKLVAFLVSKQGQDIIGHSVSYEYPLGDGATTSAPETPFADLQPYPISIADFGDGSTAIALLRQAGLL